MRRPFARIVTLAVCVAVYFTLTVAKGASPPPAAAPPQAPSAKPVTPELSPVPRAGRSPTSAHAPRLHLSLLLLVLS